MNDTSFGALSYGSSLSAEAHEALPEPRLATSLLGVR